eukprot:TRINITY_DN1887_c0_g1_i2.p1 TRINITY_DN1887_c0_g1~~TRINITY_DN1887_c0_g1_i2.p1  ORF type:complete len:187 (-),score=33.00 TRINITY_DN1887_c0_g1_i2:73-576(-)
MPYTVIEDEDEFNEALTKAEDKLVVIDFWATWCGPCKAIAPAYQRMSDEYKNAVFLKVDVDEVPEVSNRFGVRALPTFVFLRKGNVLTERKGADERSLEATIKSLLEANSNGLDEMINKKVDTHKGGKGKLKTTKIRQRSVGTSPLPIILFVLVLAALGYYNFVAKM